MPLIGVSVVVTAAGLTTSQAPTTSTTSVLAKSSLMSCISKSFSYSTSASASSTCMWPGMRPATGCTAKRTCLPSFSSRLARRTTSKAACARAMP